MQKKETRKAYMRPTVAAYGSVAEVTGNQSSSGSDVPLGPTTIGTDPGTYYSVGK